MVLVKVKSVTSYILYIEVSLGKILNAKLLPMLRHRCVRVCVVKWLLLLTTTIV